MFYILLATVLFISSVFVHILICRHTSKTGLQAKAFIVTAMVFLGVYGLGVAILPVIGLSFKFTAAIIFFLLIPIYLSFYVLTQLTSPSKKILSAVSHGGEISFNDIVACVEKEDFIGSRLNDLCASGCVRVTDGRYILTANGQKIDAVLNLMQMILGRKAGG